LGAETSVLGDFGACTYIAGLANSQGYADASLLDQTLRSLDVAMAGAALLLACSDSKTEGAAPRHRLRPQRRPCACRPGQACDRPVVQHRNHRHESGLCAKDCRPGHALEFHRHQFRTDGCDITLVSDEADKVIESVEIDIAPSCNLSLKSVLNVSEGQPDIKLGDLTLAASSLCWTAAITPTA
jgi:hypothetical protein